MHMFSVLICVISKTVFAILGHRDTVMWVSLSPLHSWARTKGLTLQKCNFEIVTGIIISPESETDTRNILFRVVNIVEKLHKILFHNQFICIEKN